MVKFKETCGNNVKKNFLQVFAYFADKPYVLEENQCHIPVKSTFFIYTDLTQFCCK